MNQLDLDIQEARIITSTSQFTLDTYMVLDTNGDPIGDNPQRIHDIRQGLIGALKNPDDYMAIIQRRVPRQLKHFAFAPQVKIYNDPTDQFSILELSAPDRPGLLARLGQLFLEFDLSLLNAKIDTLGERVEDVFYLLDAQQQPLNDPTLRAQLQQAIISQLTDANEQYAPQTSFNL